MRADEVFVNCDVLEELPELNRRNYEFETSYLVETLPQGASVLQIGSMDGTRAVRLLQQRPDVEFCGLEIERSLVDMARANVSLAGVKAEFVCGDITAPPALESFDYVLCLNHTMGYILDEASVISGMHSLGRTATMSVYGETFNDDLASAYFQNLGLSLAQVTPTTFFLSDGWSVRRYSRSDVEGWGGSITSTPLGYLSTHNW